MWTDESSTSSSPNPERTEACADSSLITQLFNDKFIEGLACVLAVDDEKIVGMAEKIVEGAKSEHGTLDLDAWTKFTSLPIWQNDKLIQYSTKMGPKQEHLYQQIQETKVCFSDDPSLEPLLAEKQHISRDVSPTRAKKSLDRGLDDGTDSWASKDFKDFEEESWACCAFDKSFVADDLFMTISSDDESWACCAFDKSFVADDLFMTVPSDDEEKLMENLADEVMKDHKIDQLLPDLLGTVDSDSPLGALEHFDKVKEVWGNRRFVDHLLKFDKYRTRDQAQNVSNVRLSIKIRSLIKKDTLFEMISEYDDPDFRMRVALSILIGFWSNQGMIRPLVCTMGGDALGVEKVQRGEGKEESPRDWMSDNTPNIMEFYNDKSIRELADKLKEEPIAVELVEVYLKTLKLDDCYCSYDEHFQRASCFWFHPSIILKFKKAMNKDPELVKVLTKYSKGAETLRRQERMVHIRKDFQPELRAIDSNDSRSKTRLALNILFGYWVDQDVTQLYLSLRCLKIRIGKVFDLSEDAEIEEFYYFASSAKDKEGLKSWLANKYGRGSKKALSLAEQIGNYQEAKGKEAEERGYSGGPLCIQLVLNESSILTFSLCWFGSSNDTSDFKELLGIHIPLLQ